jgi:hypothetical protein
VGEDVDVDDFSILFGKKRTAKNYWEFLESQVDKKAVVGLFCCGLFYG